MGKSGLVGAKIAATLTSTGTPAFFLHPTDALHGDLGIVSGQDVLLAISKSGRSAELLHLLPYVQRRGTPVIAIVESAKTPLAESAAVVIELGKIEEACSLDLVPTSSTTAAMAVGDALAVALFRRRGLTPEDFAFVHPGGLIGRQVARRVRDLMHGGDKLPRIAESATLRDALVEIVDKGLGVTTVVDGAGKLLGILTDGDLKRILLGPHGDGALKEPVAKFMSRAPRTIAPDASGRRRGAPHGGAPARRGDEPRRRRSGSPRRHHPSARLPAGGRGARERRGLNAAPGIVLARPPLPCQLSLAHPLLDPRFVLC